MSKIIHFSLKIFLSYVQRLNISYVKDCGEFPLSLKVMMTGQVIGYVCDDDYAAPVWKGTLFLTLSLSMSMICNGYEIITRSMNLIKFNL